MQTLNLFFEEPDPDRWLPLDHYPRRMIRRMVRGKPRAGGQMRVFLNLCAGLDLLGIRYRINRFRYAEQHPDEIACIVGKPQVLNKARWRNRIMFGAAVYSHPLTDPNLLKRLPIGRVLVPGEWMRKMFEPYYGDAVVTWPVGIDTESWKPDPDIQKRSDFLLYDKVRWEHENYERTLIEPIRQELYRRRFSYSEIRYGYYDEGDFRDKLRSSRAMIFLCEHETQGIAYQQALACGIPILAWDRGGYWQDPSFYPHRVKFGPVTSVPYWDERCGRKFTNVADFPENLSQLCASLDYYRPRDYILENLTLEICAQEYLEHLRSLTGSNPDKKR
jgi:glycosyltransferase involved in cell wall biosynthesis